MGIMQIEIHTTVNIISINVLPFFFINYLGVIGDELKIPEVVILIVEVNLDDSSTILFM